MRARESTQKPKNNHNLIVGHMGVQTIWNGLRTDSDGFKYRMGVQTVQCMRFNCTLDIVCTFFLVKSHVPEVSPSRCDLDPEQLSLPVDLMEEGRSPVVLANKPDEE